MGGVVTAQQPYKPDTRALAEALLRAVDEGTLAGDLARSLAVEVLATTVPSSAPWVRALAVVEGGPLRMRNAVELAGLVLDTGQRVTEAGPSMSTRRVVKE